MRDHRKLRAFELADEVTVLVYRITRKFPKEEMFGLTSQIRRAAVSVPSNIVEGCARDSQTEYVRFLNIAFGSLRELSYQLNLSNRLGYLSSKDYAILEPIVVETEKVLNGLIRAFRKTGNKAG
ncbi:four helix bundle protein [Desulfococcus multivorans]|uniref:CHP02436-containing protein n=1 Tax=Desulfococcus multivorans DSM 2059 TaxID=1121405 RepID=S7TCH2_DESML|nr:four helix bundle protein [Desulfococcus multivorans]AOY58752.1 S23 ribosomal protein [Desulfococcus multivorans]AQV01036.1 four helix bundle protein [Desulfococcus multivorans]EPR34336.1 CHP02436-containing protein [Desulfococcus multivorans DSM 2059]SJZ49435.1 four helix bundle protein [Desulfococcus multivorans DSM 2059]